MSSVVCYFDSSVLTAIETVSLKQMQLFAAKEGVEFICKDINLLSDHNRETAILTYGCILHPTLIFRPNYITHSLPLTQGEWDTLITLSSQNICQENSLFLYRASESC